MWWLFIFFRNLCDTTGIRDIAPGGSMNNSNPFLTYSSRECAQLVHLGSIWPLTLLFSPNRVGNTSLWVLQRLGYLTKKKKNCHHHTLVSNSCSERRGILSLNLVKFWLITGSGDFKLLKWDPVWDLSNSRISVI